MYRVSANYLTVRTCSTYHDSGGTVHNVTAAYKHENYRTYVQDYDVAVVQVCTELNIPIESAMCVRCVCCDISLYLIFRHFRKIAKSDFNFSMSVRIENFCPQWTEFLED